ncbi:peroxide stress protein YaaA [Flavobacterium sp. I3-2]|uniref:peroxide stress protein YaaA n=1 Tax=Flavobacterium sp. I3-2 TaxID=2748319 RepID=UPI0015A867F1|nr:peroxide stress protein YaaA [Flavobacterium sp. I3-2]
MKLVISPAKSLDYTTAVPTELVTIPFFLETSKTINKSLKKLSPKDLSELMSISDKLAELNWQRNQERNFEATTVLENARQAVFAFNGEVYTGLDAFSIPSSSYEVLNDKVRILSGMYGILKPFDLIEPYRLEMGKKLKVGKKENLYQIWKPLVTDFLNKELNADDVLVNLASTEYFSAVDTKLLKAKVVTPEFKDYKDDKLKMISFFAKKARGLMARYIIDNEIDSIDGLKFFNAEGYAFDESLSTENKYVFTR